MKGELFINEKDAWTTWGVNMGEGFLDTLDAPLPMKDYIENDSRLEHGKRMLTTDARVDSRELTLEFTIMGNDQADYRNKRKTFLSELQQGAFTLSVPALGEEVYHLVYTGKNISYDISLDRTFGRMSSKFTEPNPADRE